MNNLRNQLKDDDYKIFNKENHQKFFHDIISSYPDKAQFVILNKKGKVITYVVVEDNKIEAIGLMKKGDNLIYMRV